MLPPVGCPGSSNPAGATTWTRMMFRPSRAPSAPSRPPCGRAESHPLPIRRTCQYVLRGNRGEQIDLADVIQDQQASSLTALGRAQATAYPAGEYVGQESFMRAAEVRRLAHQARVGPGVSVLDLCCGVAGPGRMITAESGCRYLGVDHSASALAIARMLAGDLPCRFEQAHLPSLPEGRFE